MSAVADWLADATGFWLAAFIIVTWAITTAVNDPTFLLPYDRCVMNALLAVAIIRLVHRGTKARGGQ